MTNAPGSVSEVGRILAVGLACFAAGGLYGWSALIAPLEQAFAISTTQAGRAFSVSLVCFTLVVLAVPLAFPRGISDRQMGVLAGLGAMCILGARLSGGFTAFQLWFNVGFGAVSGAIYIAATTRAAGMQAHQRATPVIVACFGAGGAVFGPLWRGLYNEGWGLAALDVLVGALIFSALILMFMPAQATPARAKQVGPAKAGARKQVRLIWLTFALGSYSGLMVLGLAAKMIDSLGAASVLVSVTLAGIAICNTGGRLSVAWLGSRFGVERCLYFSCCATLCGLAVILIWPGNSLVLCVGLLLVAGGYGMVASGIPVVTRSVFGADQFQARFARIFTAWGVAGLTAPWVAGALIDINGTLAPAIFTALCVSAAFGVLCWVLSREVRLA